MKTAGGPAPTLTVKLVRNILVPNMLALNTLVR
jgi:hypothetical protein